MCSCIQFSMRQSELCDYRAADVHVEITGTEKEERVRMNTVCSLTFPGGKESLELCIPQRKTPDLSCLPCGGRGQPPRHDSRRDPGRDWSLCRPAHAL